MQLSYRSSMAAAILLRPGLACCDGKVFNRWSISANRDFNWPTRAVDVLGNNPLGTGRKMQP